MSELALTYFLVVAWNVVCSIDDDARYAMELQRKELISQKRERLKREAEDMVYK